jgi:hypothetical protein
MSLSETVFARLAASRCAECTSVLRGVEWIQQRVKRVIECDLSQDKKQHALHVFDKELLEYEPHKLVAKQYFQGFVDKIRQFRDIREEVERIAGEGFLDQVAEECKLIQSEIQILESEICDRKYDFVEIALLQTNNEYDFARDLSRRFFLASLFFDILWNHGSAYSLKFAITFGLDLEDAAKISLVDYDFIYKRIKNENLLPDSQIFSMFCDGFFDSFEAVLNFYFIMREEDRKSIEIVTSIGRQLHFRSAFKILRRRIHEKNFVIDPKELSLILQNMLIGDPHPIMEIFLAADFLKSLYNQTFFPGYLAEYKEFIRKALNLVSEFPNEKIPFYILTYKDEYGKAPLDFALEKRHEAFFVDNRIYRMFSTLWDFGHVYPEKVQKENLLFERQSGIKGSMRLLVEFLVNPWKFESVPRCRYIFSQFCYLIYLIIFCLFVLIDPGFPKTINCSFATLEITLYLISYSSRKNRIVNCSKTE